MSEKKKIFSWNHISEKLNENQIERIKILLYNIS